MKPYCRGHDVGQGPHAPCSIGDEGGLGYGMLQYPNLRHIRIFHASVRFNSLSKAAEAIHLSQPAASQAVAKLERQFGGSLLERHGSGVVATPRGAILARRCQRVLDLLRAAGTYLARQPRAGKRVAQDLMEVQATIAHLQALSFFAETGSFTAAARAVGKTQPSVQRAAREVETIVGVPLFDGAFRTLRFTAAGQMLATHASLILKELESALEDVREFEGGYDGRVVVGTLPLARTRIIPTAVAEVAQLRPQASIEIKEGDYDSLVAALVGGRVDLLVGALRSGPLNHGLTQEPLFMDQLCVIGRSGHPLAGRKIVTCEDLGEYPWVVSRHDTPTRAIFTRLSERFPLAWRERGLVTTGSMVTARGILMQTDRLTILSRRQVDYDERAGLLAVIPFDLGDTERPIGLTTRADWQPTALQSEFLAALRRAASETEAPVHLVA